MLVYTSEEKTLHEFFGQPNSTLSAAKVTKYSFGIAAKKDKRWADVFQRLGVHTALLSFDCFTGVVGMTDQDIGTDTSGKQMTEIQSFFSGSSVFITGATGFLGHVLLAKLLKYVLLKIISGTSTIGIGMKSHLTSRINAFSQRLSRYRYDIRSTTKQKR